MRRLIPQNTQRDAPKDQHRQHDGLHLSANPRQTQTLGFGRGCVAAPAGVLGHPGRPEPRHHTPTAPGRPSHFAARNSAASAPSAASQGRSTSCTTATTANTTPATCRASAPHASGPHQPSTPCSGAPGRSGRHAQRCADASHHGRGEQQPTTRTLTCTLTCTRHSRCACGPGARSTAHAHPCQRQRSPM